MKKNPSTANPPSGETKQNNPETSRNLKFLLFFYKTRFKDRCGSSDDIERVFFLDVTKTNRSRLANLKKSRSISVEPATWKVGKGRRVMGGGGGRGGEGEREKGSKSRAILCSEFNRSSSFSHAQTIII